MFRFRKLLKLRSDKSGTRILYIASFMIFFWVIFDSILSYIVPILITQRGFSGTELGFIFAFSSISGASFDIFLSKFLNNSNYLKTFFLLLLISFTFPFALWYASHLFLYLLAMAIWGLYYDLYNFSVYDFVSRHQSDAPGRSVDFGVIELFRSLGGFIATVLAGLLIVGNIQFFNLTMALIFLIVAVVLYLLLVIFSPSHHLHDLAAHHHRSFIVEIKLWRQIGILILPVLLFTISMNVFDAVFWTIGPLFSGVFPGFPYFSGILMALYNLPSLLTAWKVEPLTSRLGKKRTAYLSLIIACLLLIPVGYLHSPYLVLFFIFLSSLSYSITWPAIESAFTDYVSESRSYDSDIEGLFDFTTNIGYVIGPICAGILSDRVGISHSFTIFGISLSLFITFLLFITPRHINVRVRRH